jgi:hypothetical protein
MDFPIGRGLGRRFDIQIFYSFLFSFSFSFRVVCIFLFLFVLALFLFSVSFVFVFLISHRPYCLRRLDNKTAVRVPITDSWPFLPSLPRSFVLYTSSPPKSYCPFWNTKPHSRALTRPGANCQRPRSSKAAMVRCSRKDTNAQRPSINIASSNRQNDVSLSLIVTTTPCVPGPWVATPVPAQLQTP